MKRISILFVMAIFFSGCASAGERMPGFTHTAALIVGESESNVVHQAEHILMSPKKEGTLGEFKTRRYAFTNVYDLILYFYNGIFIQPGFIEPNSDTYPSVRPDFKEVRKGSPGPIGYVITTNGKTMSIKTLWKKGEEPK